MRNSCSQTQQPRLIRKVARFGKKREVSGIVFTKGHLLKQKRAACLFGGGGSNNATDMAPPPEILRKTAHAPFLALLNRERSDTC